MSIRACVLLSFAFVGCGPSRGDDDPFASFDSGARVDASSTTPDMSTSAPYDAAQSPDASFSVNDAGVILMPVRNIPGLESIDFWEATSGAHRYTFTVGGSELNEMVTGELDGDNADISGAPTEFYDVYYSNADGSFNANGAYLTISGVFGQSAPAGGGLNLAEIQLNTPGFPPEYGTIVGSFVALGDNKIPESINNCIDGDINTATTMGNTSGTTERLRITLGFESTVILQ